MIICFFHIQLAQKSKYSQFESIIQTLFGNKNQIKDLPTFDKGILRL